MRERQVGGSAAMRLYLILRLFLANYVTTVGVVGWGTRSRVAASHNAKIHGTRSDILADNGISYEEMSTDDGMHTPMTTQIHSSPLVRSTFCPINFDYTSRLTL